MAPRVSRLAAPSATAEVLERFGLSPKKGFGQNFLVNDDVVRKILELAHVGAEDDVLEVGPGIGTLTCALAAHARSVVSVERDADLVPVLADTMGGHRAFELVMRDALDLTAGDLERASAALAARGVASGLPDKLVANLPYAVAATVVLRFFQDLPSLESATVMVQREVAERMQARPGTKEYGAYTVKLALHARPAGSFGVSAACFLPRPRVESTVIRLDRIEPGDDLGDAAPEVVSAACEMADAAFFARRKTIANSCRAYFASHGDDLAARAVPEVLERAGVDSRVRGEALAPKAYLALGSALLQARGSTRSV